MTRTLNPKQEKRLRLARHALIYAEPKLEKEIKRIVYKNISCIESYEVCACISSNYQSDLYQLKLNISNLISKFGCVFGNLHINE